MEEPQVEVQQGILRGKELRSENGNSFYGFMGIPYAKPPLGDLRFKPPQSPNSWKDVRDATKEGNPCKSLHLILKNRIGDEDCLFLNVYTPKISDQLLPVMFWIHGGGFVMGSGNKDMYGPDYLMDYGVVLVTINYRLGVFGFLNLEIEEAPGNMGLMDQVAALRWVKDNIAAFGGDPHNVTIFGESAGGASVHYLILSDLTRGLFHKAISQSGSALNPWAIQINPTKNAFALCKVLGHPTSSKEEAVKFLRKVSSDDLLDAKIPPEDDGQLVNDYPFVPSIEKRFPSFQPFLDELPAIKMKSGKFNKVPFMAGYNSAEGILALMDFSKDSKIFDKFEADFERFVPSDLNLRLRSEASVKLAKDMRMFYYGNEPVTSSNKERFVTLMGDTWFLRGITNMVNYAIDKSTEPVYLYKYTFDEFGFLKKLVYDPDVKGASHADELGYLFKIDLTDFPKDLPNAIRNRNRLLQLWTNFAKTGNPTPKINDILTINWDPATKENQYYLDIGKTLEMCMDPDKNRLKFWEQFT